jgi:hypothetical protein
MPLIDRGALELPIGQLVYELLYSERLAPNYELLDDVLGGL